METKYLMAFHLVDEHGWHKPIMQPGDSPQLIFHSAPVVPRVGEQVCFSHDEEMRVVEKVTHEVSSQGGHVDTCVIRVYLAYQPHLEE